MLLDKTGSKVVSHIWELGGEHTSEPKLLELALSSRYITTSSVVICIDLSHPQQILYSTLNWLTQIRLIITKKLNEIKSNLRNNSYIGHIDENKVNPCEIPIYIIANKYDIFKTMTNIDKKFILQILRFISHYNGAMLLCTSGNDPSMKESSRNILSMINFHTNMKSTFDINLDRPFCITPGQDNFNNILLGNEKDGKVSCLLYLFRKSVFCYLLIHFFVDSFIFLFFRFIQLLLNLFIC